jgi:hypothetical protein
MGLGPVAIVNRNEHGFCAAAAAGPAVARVKPPRRPTTSKRGRRWPTLPSVVGADHAPATTSIAPRLIEFDPVTKHQPPIMAGAQVVPSVKPPQGRPLARGFDSQMPPDGKSGKGEGRLRTICPRVVPLAEPVAAAIARRLPPDGDPGALVFTGPGGSNGLPSASPPGRSPELQQKASERGGRSSGRLSGLLRRPPSSESHRRRPPLVPPRSPAPYPVVPVMKTSLPVFACIQGRQTLTLAAPPNRANVAAASSR